MKRSQILKTLAGFFTLGTVTASQAAIDTAAVVTELSSNNTAIVAVGGAMLALAAVAVGIKWIKATIFG